MAKLSIKDKLEGNELDLSLNELTEVPVQDLASIPKATHLDLSCNKIKALPNNFSLLTHLVRIDLSKNLLSELPHNFGNLINLQNLDLYGNNVVMLPISFCRLKSLKWLDLKNNPLDPKLKAIAGDCLDQKQCQTCAKNVVSFMQSIESELERQKQKRLKEERFKQQQRLAKEAEELAEQRRIRKAERERKKAEAKAKVINDKREDVQTQALQQNGEKVELQKKKFLQNNKYSWLKSFVKLIMISLFLLFSALTCYAVINRSHRVENLSGFSVVLQESYTEVRDILVIWWQAFALPYFLSLKGNLLSWVQSAL